jgi:archaellum component FlaC
MPPQDDTTFIMQTITVISQKLDMLIATKLDIQSYEKRHEELEKRIDRVERQVEEITRTITGLHNNSMAFVNENILKQTEAMHLAVQGVEQRILAEIKDKAKTSTAQKLTVWIAIGGWIITLLLAMVGMFLQFHHP